MARMGDPTRGKTRPGRLRLLDDWLLDEAADVLGRRDGAWATAWVVDVGLGHRPDTTVELHRALRERWPDARTLGVDVVEDYVEAARAHEEDGLSFRLGDARLPLAPDEPARLVRAANLLRQIRLDAVPDALASLAEPLLPGGLLVEGSTDRPGGVGVFRVLRRSADDLVDDGLVFVTDFSRGFAPRLFTAWLPRGLGWHGHAGPEVAALFEAWASAFEDAGRAHPGLRPPDRFVTVAAALALRLPGIVADPDGWRSGRLRWRPRFTR